MAKRSSNRNINTDIFCALKVAEKSRVPVLFLSNPGAGKSTTVSLFAKVRGYEVVLLRGNSTTAEEVMGYDVAPRDVSYDHKMAAISLRPSWFEEVVRNHEAGKKTLLFLDEITTANEFVQAALLHLIFERQEDPLEKGMATHSSILAWRIPWAEEPGGLQSIEMQTAGHD